MTITFLARVIRLEGTENPLPSYSSRPPLHSVRVYDRESILGFAANRDNMTRELIVPVT